MIEVSCLNVARGNSRLTTQDQGLRTHNSGLAQKLNDTPARSDRVANLAVHARGIFEIGE